MTKTEALNKAAQELGYLTFTDLASNGFDSQYDKALFRAMDIFAGGWISVDERPLFFADEHGNWVCTEEGDGEFIAAVPYCDSETPYKTLWWIRHCVIEDNVGLCVVGDDENEPAGWELEDVTHWQPLPTAP